MSVKARINTDNELLITGTLSEDKSVISLDKGGNLSTHRVYKKELAFNADLKVSEEHLLSDKHLINEEQGMEVFLAWFFGVDLSEVNPNEVRFLDGKSILANDVKDNQNLGDG